MILLVLFALSPALQPRVSGKIIESLAVVIVGSSAGPPMSLHKQPMFAAMFG